MDSVESCKMSRSVVFLLSALTLTIRVVNPAYLQLPPASPYGLEDELKGQLEELRALIKGTISQAVDELDNVYEEMAAYSLNVQEDAFQYIESWHESVITNLKSVEDKAEINQIDISTCTSGKEATFNEYHDESKRRMTTDIESNNMEGTKLLEKAKYEVDTIINEVGNLEFQLDRCQGQVLCIAPIEGEISSNMVRLPQNVRSQVNEVTAYIEDVKVLVRKVSDNIVYEYVDRVLPLITYVVSCAYQILNP